MYSWKEVQNNCLEPQQEVTNSDSLGICRKGSYRFKNLADFFFLYRCFLLHCLIGTILLFIDINSWTSSFIWILFVSWKTFVVDRTLNLNLNLNFMKFIYNYTFDLHLWPWSKSSSPSLRSIEALCRVLHINFKYEGNGLNSQRSIVNFEIFDHWPKINIYKK